MPIKNYGVLKGRPVDHRPGSEDSAHYQIRLKVEDGTDFRIAVNVKSRLAPSEVMCLVVEDFHNPLTTALQSAPSGFTPLANDPEVGAIDYVRGDLFNLADMVPLKISIAGENNDLNDKVGRLVTKAMAQPDAQIYALGERFGPEKAKADKYFGFLPGNGIHDIHMNQGNSGTFARDNGVFQDGGLLFQFPSEDKWSAVFLRFQSQSLKTNDKTGHPLNVAPFVLTPLTLPQGRAQHHAILSFLER